MKRRLEEGYDIEDDAQFMTWKILKTKELSINKEIDEGSISKSSLEDDLRPIIEDVLTFPQKTENPKKRKISLPRHLTSEEALKVLEAQDLDKRRKETLREAKRRKIEEAKSKKRNCGKESSVNATRRKNKKTKDEKTKRNAGEESEYECGECSIAYNENDEEDWVECGNWSSWYHVSCTNLNYMNMEDIYDLDWKCIRCE